MIYVGVDPDVAKNGVCVYRSKNDFELLNLTFFELFTKLKSMNYVKVYIEAGWLNKSNWHKVVKGSAAINANIGLRTGANHEVGRKVIEMCKYLEIECILIRPSKTKMDSETFKKITGYSKRSNQEQRDAFNILPIFSFKF